MQASWQLPLAMRKLQLWGGGGGYTTLRLPTLDSCSCGKGRSRLGGWADRQRHLPSVCVVPRHVFKWHRLHFNSDIIHKCGTAAYKSERRKLHCYRKEQGEGKTTVDTELPTRVGERERVKKKTKHLATIRRLPGLSCQVQDLRAGTTGTTLAKGQGLKAAHTQEWIKKDRQS